MSIEIQPYSIESLVDTCNKLQCPDMYIKMKSIPRTELDPDYKRLIGIINSSEGNNGKYVTYEFPLEGLYDDYSNEKRRAVINENLAALIRLSYDLQAQLPETKVHHDVYFHEFAY